MSEELISLRRGRQGCRGADSKDKGLQIGLVALRTLSLLRIAGRILLLMAGCFFILFGVQVLISAYRLNDPFMFIMTFFASNLIILISAVLTLGFAIRLFRSEPKEEAHPENRKEEG